MFVRIGVFSSKMSQMSILAILPYKLYYFSKNVTIYVYLGRLGKNVTKVDYFVTKRSIFDQKRNKLRFEVFIFLLERFFLVPALFPTLKKVHYKEYSMFHNRRQKRSKSFTLTQELNFSTILTHKTVDDLFVRFRVFSSKNFSL